MSKWMQELMDQSEEQLAVRLGDLQEELFHLKNELATNHKLERPHLIQKIKKEKARILTLLSARKKGDKDVKK